MRRVLNSLDSLAEVLPDELKPFLTFFKEFKKVRDAAFNANSYDVECPVYVEDTLKALEGLEEFGVNCIPKFHLLLHVPAFCESQGNVPLGKYGDQGIEQCHQIYERAWERFKCNDTQNPNFKGRQLSSLLTYNYEQMFKMVVKTKKKKREE